MELTKIPNVPERFSQDVGCSSGSGCANEHNQDFRDQDTDTLAPGNVAVRMTIAGDVRLVDQNRRESTHHGVDGRYHGPDKLMTGQLSLFGGVPEVAKLSSVRADSPAEHAQERNRCVDCFDDEQVTENLGMNEHDGHLDLCWSVSCS